MKTDKERAARIRDCVLEFERGCSNTQSFKGGKIDPGTPEDCEECAKGFLDAVREALA